MSAPLQSVGKRRTSPAEAESPSKRGVDKETEAAIAWIRRRSREIAADPVKARKYLIEIGAVPNPS